jgi:Zn-dependent M16 (insulinase) family peptidase
VEKEDESALREHILRGKNRVPYSTWLKVGDVVNGFKLQSVERIEFFDINAYKLEHEATGARYLHLDCSDMDNVFAVLFRTPPDDHTGKPHILEHLATCGTSKYPVRDPFFNMIKRSLNTYMNAWTGSDFTMYPFST